MGKRIIVQRRGTGNMRYRAHSFNFLGEAKFPPVSSETKTGLIKDLVHCAAHTAPLAQVECDGETSLLLACEGMKVGDVVTYGDQAQPVAGNILTLKNIPEGALIYNIEGQPGDGGKFVRASGTFARIVTKMANGIIIRLPSRKQRLFNENCRAAIGVLAGGGRLDKPLLKAGVAHHKHKARNHLYPIVAGSAKNAVNHPYGNKRTSRHAKKRPVSRDAPPGRKVGMIAARRTGRKKK